MASSRKTVLAGLIGSLVLARLARTEALHAWLDQRAEEREGIDVGTGIIKRRGGRLRFLPPSEADAPLTRRERLLTPFWLVADPLRFALHYLRYEAERPRWLH